MAKAPRALRYGSSAAMPSGMRGLYERQHAYRPPAEASAPARGSKYGAQPTVVDGIRFDSKAEARYYQRLQALVASGAVRYFLRQVSIYLPGKTRYVVDFLEFWADGRVRYVDVKGVQTAMFKTKKRQVEALYPIQIEIEK